MGLGEVLVGASRWQSSWWVEVGGGRRRKERRKNFLYVFGYFDVCILKI